jgi:hypothetical protein
MRALLAFLVVVAASANSYADDDAAAPAPPGETAESGRRAEKGTLGVGLIIGEPTGISAKLYLKDDQAIQAAAGSAFIGGGLQLHGDYVFHPLILQDRESFVLPVYVGPGLRFIQYTGGRGDDSHFAVGARGVLGMLFDFKDVPLDVFVEVAGVLEYDFTEGWGPALNAGAGVRYYF